ncbi:response regulator [Roseateles albus]|uniref:Response regulator n=1 Tax=Roseateles albus TaxID=2987525 RepID=A0ABT5KLP5_9BURK|nr:response regulator [Roseateles albus]
MSNKGKILVVDDDRLVLATLTYGLAQAGFEVIDADNGDDAILLAREHRPELALLDIRMEGLSGFDVAAYLREYLHIPFMFLSAFADEETVAKVKELGAVAYLVKPLDIHQIVPAVEAAFANRKQAATASPPACAPVTPVAQVTQATLHELLPVAVGVLMHRYSLSRQDALERLQKLAAAEGRDTELQARLLVEAVEMLAQPASVK